MAEAAVATVKQRAAPRAVVGKWSGKTKAGEVRAGEMEAGDAGAVESRLRQMGIEPTKVRKKSAEPRGPHGRSRRRHQAEDRRPQGGDLEVVRKDEVGGGAHR